MQRFEEEFSMGADEARSVAESFARTHRAEHGEISVMELATALRATPEEIARLLANVRNQTAFERDRSRERRNLWLTGVAALGVTILFAGAFFAGKSQARPVIIERPATVWAGETVPAWEEPPPMPDAAIASPTEFPPDAMPELAPEVEPRASTR